MFRTATHSFARPISIVAVRPGSSAARWFDILTSGACSRSHARLCIRTVEHVNTARRVKPCGPAAPTLFLELLQAADESRARNLFRGLFDPAVFKIFVR